MHSSIFINNSNKNKRNNSLTRTNTRTCTHTHAQLEYWYVVRVIGLVHLAIQTLWFVTFLILGSFRSETDQQYRANDERFDTYIHVQSHLHAHINNHVFIQ